MSKETDADSVGSVAEAPADPVGAGVLHARGVGEEPLGDFDEDFFEAHTTTHYFKEGEIVEGTIVKVDRDEVLLDISGGLAPGSPQSDAYARRRLIIRASSILNAEMPESYPILPRNESPSAGELLASISMLALSELRIREELNRAATDAKLAGATWAAIGAAAGISGQAAHTRWSQKGREAHREAQRRAREGARRAREPGADS